MFAAIPPLGLAYGTIVTGGGPTGAPDMGSDVPTTSSAAPAAVENDERCCARCGAQDDAIDARTTERTAVLPRSTDTTEGPAYARLAPALPPLDLAARAAAPTAGGEPPPASGGVAVALAGVATVAAAWLFLTPEKRRRNPRRRRATR